MDNTEKPTDNKHSREDLLKKGAHLLSEAELTRRKYEDADRRIKEIKELLVDEENEDQIEAWQEVIRQLQDDKESFFQEILDAEDRYDEVHRLVHKKPRQDTLK